MIFFKTTHLPEAVRQSQHTLAVAHSVFHFSLVATSVGVFPHACAMGISITVQIAFVNPTIVKILFALSDDLVLFKGANQAISTGKCIGALTVAFAVLIVTLMNITVFESADSIAVAVSVNKFAFIIIFGTGINTVAMAFVKSPLPLVARTVRESQNAVAMLHVVMKLAFIMISIVPNRNTVALP